MQIRNTKPVDNKFYITTEAGGYNTAIVGKPTDPEANVLANCVGYAQGRFNEIIGEFKYKTLNCNAENFIERAVAAGLAIVADPTLGGIMVFQKGATLGNADGAGHVMIVEQFHDDNQIYTSESSYGSTLFYNAIRTRGNGNWGMNNTYSYRGCIVNPAIGEVRYIEIGPEPIPEPEPEPEPTPEPVPAVETYTVQKGDTLGQIALDMKWCKGSELWGANGYVAKLAKANNIENPDLIYPGQVIAKA